MKKLFTLLIPMALQAGLCTAQNIEWLNTVGGPSNDNVSGVTTDANGNVISTGSFQLTVDFDPASGVSNLTATGDDVYVVKQASNGLFTWVKQFGGNGTDYGRKVRTDANGNVYVMGLFSGSVDFDPGPGISSLLSQSVGTLQDLFVVKLDAAGNFVWAIQRQSPNAETLVNDCDLQIQGNDIYMAYSFGAGYASDRVFIEKASTSTGAATWTKAINTTTGSSTAPLLGYANIAVDAGGNVLVAGEFAGNVDFDPNGTHIEEAVYSPSAYVLKLDNAGNFVWVSPIFAGVGSLSRAFTVAADGASNVIIGGRFAGTTDFDPGTGVHNETSSNGIVAYVLKLNSAGNFSWVKTIGHSNWNSTNDLTADASGYIYATGFFSDSCTFGAPPNEVKFKGNINSFQEGFIVKMNGAGNLEWARHMGGGLTNTVEGLAVAVSKTGSVYTGGAYNQTANFNPEGTAYVLSGMGNFDGYLLKIEGCPFVNNSVTVSGSTLTAAATGVSYQWINCANSTPITGATSQTYTPAVTGSYSVMVMQNGCSNTSACNTVFGTDVKDVQQTAAFIYPNPTTGALSIELKKRYSNVEVVITSAVGAVVSKTAYHDVQSVNTNINGANGIYFISVATDGETIVRERVVKAD